MESRTEGKTSRFEIDKLEPRIAPIGAAAVAASKSSKIAGRRAWCTLALSFGNPDTSDRQPLARTRWTPMAISQWPKDRRDGVSTRVQLKMRRFSDAIPVRSSGSRAASAFV